jgi:hypothetical protein
MVVFVSILKSVTKLQLRQPPLLLQEKQSKGQGWQVELNA